MYAQVPRQTDTTLSQTADQEPQVKKIAIIDFVYPKRFCDQ